MKVCFNKVKRVLLAVVGERKSVIYWMWAVKNLAIPKPRTLSLPKILAIFLSGKKYCLFSGSWRLWSLRYFHNILMHCAREASFIPTTSASSAETFMGLVSPDPFPLAGADILVDIDG